MAACHNGTGDTIKNKEKRTTRLALVLLNVDKEEGAAPMQRGTMCKVEVGSVKKKRREIKK